MSVVTGGFCAELQIYDQVFQPHNRRYFAAVSCVFCLFCFVFPAAKVKFSPQKCTSQRQICVCSRKRKLEPQRQESCSCNSPTTAATVCWCGVGGGGGGVAFIDLLASRFWEAPGRLSQCCCIIVVVVVFRLSLPAMPPSLLAEAACTHRQAAVGRGQNFGTSCNQVGPVSRRIGCVDVVPRTPPPPPTHTHAHTHLLPKAVARDRIVALSSAVLRVAMGMGRWWGSSACAWIIDGLCVFHSDLETDHSGTDWPWFGGWPSSGRLPWRRLRRPGSFVCVSLAVRYMVLHACSLCLYTVLTFRVVCVCGEGRFLSF